VGAMNLSGISKDTLFGRLIRSPLKLIPPSAVLPILQGPLRGKKWIAGSLTHGCWVGSYEYEKQRTLCRVIAPGDVVYDLGANVGYYTLLASVLAGESGHVYSLEPLPANIAVLKRHIAMNHIENCTVVEVAVAASDGEARFDPSSRGDLAHFSSQGSETVRTASIDSLLDRRALRPPRVMKIDIEGAEFDALQGATRAIEAHRPTILLATHGAEVHQRCVQFLRERGYGIESLTNEPAESSAEILARSTTSPQPITSRTQAAVQTR
jgi:FkbM family methyltransferase